LLVETVTFWWLFWVGEELLLDGEVLVSDPVGDEKPQDCAECHHVEEAKNATVHVPGEIFVFLNFKKIIKICDNLIRKIQ